MSDVIDYKSCEINSSADLMTAKLDDVNVSHVSDRLKIIRAMRIMSSISNCLEIIDSKEEDYSKWADIFDSFEDLKNCVIFPDS